jgi:hypothetical protein
MRRLLLSLHVVTSVGWMSQALALFALLTYGRTAPSPDLELAAYRMAEVLDAHVLLYLANASAFTGLMLAALTPWGYFRYWWVLVKLAITLSQLYLGIFILSPSLAACAAAAERGQDGPAGRLAAASLLMVSAIAFQAWVSVAKPWSRTPWSRSARPPRTRAWLYAAVIAIPVADYLVGVPVLQLLTVVGYPIWRARRTSAWAPPNRRGPRIGVTAQGMRWP